MKKLLAVFAALVGLATPAAAAPAWRSIESISYSGGTFGGPTLNNITLLGGASVKQIGLRVPLSCSLTLSVGVFAIQPAILVPTRLASTAVDSGYGEYIFSVNGGQGAFVSGFQVQVSGGPGAFCQVDVYTSDDDAAGPTLSGYDFSGLRSCTGLAANHACTLPANPVTDACLAQGGRDYFCGDCSVLCDRPVN